MTITFPDTAHDYQVALVGRRPDGAATRLFYQFDVRGSSLK
jgi:hypothetical protein